MMSMGRDVCVPLPGGYECMLSPTHREGAEGRNIAICNITLICPISAKKSLPVSE